MLSQPVEEADLVSQSVYHYRKYAQVIKHREKGRVKEITVTAIFEMHVSNRINVSFVERNNLTLRQHSRRLTRKTKGFSKQRAALHAHLCSAYYLSKNTVRCAFAALMNDASGSPVPQLWQQITFGR